MKPVRTAVVGLGAISGVYLQNLSERFSIIELAGCCDRKPQRTQEVARRFGVAPMTMEEILADDSIELVVNLTQPEAHYDVIKRLLLGGKHVYTEKVLAVGLAQAQELVALAQSKGLLLCAAPDTFLGAGLQTARLAVDAGLIGEVTSCVAILQRDAGLLAECFPFTAKPGGGIGLDVGVYYATALCSILGPATAVCGMSDTYRPERIHETARSGFGAPYTLQTETLLAATARFACGAVGSFHFNAASIQCEQPSLTLFGTQGILFLPDPNCFGGEATYLLKGQSERAALPHTHGYAGNERGLGAAEMAWALRQGRAPRANARMAYHALELLTGAIESGRTGAHVALRSTFERPMPLPRGYIGGGYGADEEAALALNA